MLGACAAHVHTCTAIAAMPGKPPRRAFLPASSMIWPIDFLGLASPSALELPLGALRLTAANERDANGEGAIRAGPRAVRSSFLHATGEPAVVKLTLALGAVEVAIARVAVKACPLLFSLSPLQGPDVALLSENCAGMRAKLLSLPAIMISIGRSRGLPQWAQVDPSRAD